MQGPLLNRFSSLLAAPSCTPKLDVQDIKLAALTIGQVLTLATFKPSDGDVFIISDLEIFGVTTSILAPSGIEELGRWDLLGLLSVQYDGLGLGYSGTVEEPRAGATVARHPLILGQVLSAQDGGLSFSLAVTGQAAIRAVVEAVPGFTVLALGVRWSGFSMLQSDYLALIRAAEATKTGMQGGSRSPVFCPLQR